MELEELIEKIVLQSKDKRTEKEAPYIVGTLMSDIEYWPAWYNEEFDFEEKHDFSGKKPTSTQRLNIKTLKNVFKGEGEDVATAIAERITYWEDWYWDFALRRVGTDYDEDIDQMLNDIEVDDGDDDGAE